MASFGSSARVRHGATCQRPMVPAPLVTIASFGSRIGSARGSATREATLRCGEPMQLRRADATSIVGKDFLPAIAQSHRTARCRAGPRAFCKLRDDGIVPLICPTCQNVFAGFAQGIDASDHHATLHGVVFDILVGSESRVQTLSASRQLPLRWGEPWCRQGLCVGLHRRSRRQVIWTVWSYGRFS